MQVCALYSLDFSKQRIQKESIRHMREDKQKASFQFPQQLYIFNQIRCKNYRASCVCPRVLPNHFPCTFLILKSDIKHFGKVLPKTMRGCTLYTTTSVWNEGLIKTIFIKKMIKYKKFIFLSTRIVMKRLHCVGSRKNFCINTSTLVV